MLCIGIYVSWVNAQCPDGFTAVNYGCYLLSEDKASWNEAEHHCTEKGGWLITIESASENSAVFVWLTSTGFSYTMWYLGPYIGLHRMDMNAQDNHGFHWAHEVSHEPADYFNWVYGEPLFMTGQENCVTMTNEGGAWNNYGCDDHLHYICEATYSFPTLHPSPAPVEYRAPTPQPTPPIPTLAPNSPPVYPPTPYPSSLPATSSSSCPSKFTLVGSSCYYLSNEKVNWYEANLACKKMDAWLVAIENREENFHVVGFLQSREFVYEKWYMGPHIGLYRADLSSTKSSSFEWSHGASNPPRYFNWKFEQPYFNHDIENCGVMTQHQGEWINYRCDDDKKYICEVSPSSGSSGSSLSDGAHTGMFVVLVILLPILLVAAALWYFCIRDDKGEGLSFNFNFLNRNGYDKAEDSSTHSAWNAVTLSPIASNASRPPLRSLSDREGSEHSDVSEDTF